MATMFQHSRPNMIRPRPQTLALLALALLPLACQAPPGAGGAFNSELDLLIARGQYTEAVRRAAAAVEADPSDAQAVADHRRASVAWHLENGRRATFEDRDYEALASLEMALAIDPASELVASWIEKTRRKIRTSLLGCALEAMADEDLNRALLSYGEILVIEPGHPEASEGLEHVLQRMEKRDGKADGYYRSGVDALADLWLEQARARFAYSGKYREDDERTALRAGEVDQLLAGQRLALGADLEQRGYYHAARAEYLLASKLDDSLAVALDGALRMENETAVARQLEKARMDILRGDLERAELTLEEVRGQTVLQGEVIFGLLDEVDATRTQSRYQQALSLERDNRYVAARDAYAALLADVSFYGDARARHDTLVDYIERAATLYEQAQYAADAAERRALLKQISFFWPDKLHASLS